VRSALSALLSLGYKNSLGEHPLIKRFMKGVFNQRPALPRYQHIWDVNIVLEYLASLSPVNVLSFYTLTLKFVMLLCLLSGQSSNFTANMFRGLCSDGWCIED
jgi:hypothetical protein